jgi:hypothetical protein
VVDVAVDVVQGAAERSERVYGEARRAPTPVIGAQLQFSGDRVAARFGAVDDERGVGWRGAEAEFAPGAKELA